jgi:acetyl-CoA carboxylase carboxyl transferase subunit beta
MGYVDQVIQEPTLGARPFHYDFFRSLRQELLRATDEVSISVRGFRPFRAMALRSRRKQAMKGMDLEKAYTRWNLSLSAQVRLVNRRHRKFRKLSVWAAPDMTPFSRRVASWWQEFVWGLYTHFKYTMLQRQQQKVSEFVDEVKSEWTLFFDRVFAPLNKLVDRFRGGKKKVHVETARRLTELSAWDDNQEHRGGNWIYVSAKARQDRAVTCPNATIHGCLDLWAPDLYGEFAGVCTNCGHHFPMEHQWYLHNVFDQGSIYEFAADVEASNPLAIEDFGHKLDEAKKKTGHKSGCMVFEARINHIKLVVAMLMASFRGGSVGAAEGEKFIRAAERATRKRFPFLAYVQARPASVFRRAPTASSRCRAAPWRCVAISTPGDCIL